MTKADIACFFALRQRGVAVYVTLFYIAGSSKEGCHWWRFWRSTLWMHWWLWQDAKAVGKKSWFSVFSLPNIRSVPWMRENNPCQGCRTNPILGPFWEQVMWVRQLSWSLTCQMDNLVFHKCGPAHKKAARPTVRWLALSLVNMAKNAAGVIALHSLVQCLRSSAKMVIHNETAALERMCKVYHTIVPVECSSGT